MFEARHKLKKETEAYKFCRRLEEYIEYAEHTKRFADVGFYLELIEYITTENKQSIEVLQRIGLEPQASERHYIKLAQQELKRKEKCV